MDMSYSYDNVEMSSDCLTLSNDKSDNNVEILSDSLSPSTDEDASTLMLASTNPKRRAGRKKFKETRHPVYRGIRQRNSDKWVCEVRQPKKQTRIWLGTFPTAEMAARAHDVAVLALRGPHGACLNFSDSAWRLPIPVSSDTKDIQKAAAEAAELFRPVAKPVSPKVEETVVMLPENNVFYLDEDEEFGMVELVSDMYQGLLMSPPRSNYGCDYDDDNMEFGSLWSYSF